MMGIWRFGGERTMDYGLEGKTVLVTAEEFEVMAVFLGSAANRYVTGQSIILSDGEMVRSL
jgi:hypothetical protein